MFIFTELTLTESNSCHKELKCLFFFFLCTVLDKSKISESLNLSFLRLADLGNNRLFVLSQIICRFTYFLDLMSPKVADRMENSIDPYQEQSDLSLHS